MAKQEPCEGCGRAVGDYKHKGCIKCLPSAHTTPKPQEKSLEQQQWDYVSEERPDEAVLWGYRSFRR